ncbi:MAG: hypothetical protein QM770_05075 [Tepidisphaeraceae bacterium]
MENDSQRPTQKQIRKLFHFGVMPGESRQMTRREASEVIQQVELDRSAKPPVSESAGCDDGEHVRLLNEWHRSVDQQVLQDRVATRAKRRGRYAEDAAARFLGIAEGSEGMSR